MIDLVENVARAIHDALMNPESNGTGLLVPWEIETERIKDACRKQARAAIEIMQANA